VVGDAVGFDVGLLVGETDGLVVGAAMGGVVGDGLPPALQAVIPALTQRGENESNCCKDSNTDANRQSSPVLFASKLSTLMNEFPKTATLETPTTLLLKQVFSIVKGPRVSTIKLLVVDKVLL
jgi:hypothetical protein